MIDEDGTGKGYKKKINLNNEAHVFAVTQSEQHFANKLGDAYNINTGLITLTDSVDTPVLYIKNNESRDLNILAQVFGMDTATNGVATQMVETTVIRNPTAGTIISSPTNVAINSNRNFGSNNTLAVDAYKGATGDTMTDGEDHLFFLSSDFSRLFAEIDEIVPQGSSLGVKINPPATSDSFPIYVATICHLRDPNR